MATRYFIDTPTRRKKLSPRREPYWHKIMTGRYLGFRQTERGGHWVARINIDGSQKYHTESFTDNLTFDQAVEVAGNWFSGAIGAEDHHYRVSDAIDDYVEHLKVNNSEAAASDARTSHTDRCPVCCPGRDEGSSDDYEQPDEVYSDDD